MLPLDPSRRQLYLSAKTGVFALEADPRFSYCLFVPSASPERVRARRLLVTIHHSLRNFMQCRDAFAGFAERHNLVVLAPLFPIGVLRNGDPDGYKYLLEEELRYDLVLHSMIDVVERDTGCQPRRFLLQGYSGGGHFVHRYLLLHPQRLIAASIGAPGQVTVLDEQSDWWAGVRDVRALFGIEIDVERLREVPVQLVVGEFDRGDGELTHAQGTRYWRPMALQHGTDRQQRLRSLRHSLEQVGVRTTFQTLPRATHESGAIPAIEAAAEFFRPLL